MILRCLIFELVYNIFYSYAESEAIKNQGYDFLLRGWVDINYSWVKRLECYLGAKACQVFVGR